MGTFQCTACFLLFLVLALCQSSPSEPPETRKAPETALLKAIELRSEMMLPLAEQNRLQIAPDGKTPATQVIVDMTRMEYRYQLVYLREDGTKKEVAGSAVCYELRSRGAMPYSWAMWSHQEFGNFRLFTLGDGKNILAWVQASSVVFTEVPGPNDRLLELMHHLAGERSGSYRGIPVGELVPEARAWGRNALYRDIFVQSIEEDATGRITATISGPNATRVYTLVFEAGEWHRID